MLGRSMNPTARTVLLAGSALSLFAWPLAARGRGPLFEPDGPAGASGSGSDGGGAGGGGSGGGAAAGGSTGGAGAAAGGGDDPAARAKALEKQLADAQRALSELKTGQPTAAEREELERLRKAENDRKAKEAEEERKKLEERGEFKTLLQRTQDEFKGKLTAEQQEKEAARAELRTERKLNRLSPIISKYCDLPAEAVIKMAFPDTVIAINDKGEWEIKNENGIHPTNTKGDKMTPEEFVADFVAKTPWLAKHKPEGGSGSGSQLDGAVPTGTLTDDQIAKMGPDAWKKYKAQLGLKV